MYQASLDVAQKNGHGALEKKIRSCIFNDAIYGVDEYWDRKSKLNPEVAPWISHPNLPWTVNDSDRLRDGDDGQQYSF